MTKEDSRSNKFIFSARRPPALDLAADSVPLALEECLIGYTPN